MKSEKLFSPLDQHARSWLKHGLISSFNGSSETLISTCQHNRVGYLSNVAELNPIKNPSPTYLFPSGDEFQLGRQTIISGCVAASPTVDGIDEVLLQLIPIWIQQYENTASEASRSDWERAVIGPLEVGSTNHALIERIELARTRIREMEDLRTTQFSRSAYYMGSKSALAPALSEILQTLVTPDTLILDLMTGSGSAAGVFSRSWKTLASDAQHFSTLLAKVQGGGMDASTAEKCAEEVLKNARIHYDALPSYIHDQIKIENDFLTRDLTPHTIAELKAWLSEYPRVNNPTAPKKDDLMGLVVERRIKFSSEPYLLFSAYYANLFYGVRQAAEIDSLRFAVEQLLDEEVRQWALGALICAVSSCAYSYGGHFAQPKLDVSNGERIELLAKEMLSNRGLSVSHEFFVRFCALATESEKIPYSIEQIKGPWEAAIDVMTSRSKDGPICVYFDPPYTRDEYSRYYHVLETLVRYDYPDVSGKPSIPKRGASGRYASGFSTRTNQQIELLLAQVLEQCLDRNWTCLWSYSSSAAATIDSVLNRIAEKIGSVDIFSMDHIYKAQGKHKSKPVKEYAIFIRPIARHQ
ncbi:DNA adenine methylase [Herbaspirillum frisingense]|uniref:DNA adenine methylase n=1 Tax=Herbaspirillum frisingense TaxID=92645 RepID=UPI001ADFAE47|nr:DNA adenine methylase [Herbaspirillum frisingense]